MTILDMGHGGLHAYVVNDRSTVAEAHGVQHRYVTAGHRAATLDPRVAPWGAAIHRAQSLMRGQFPELGRPLPTEQSPRSHALRQILRANGYHDAENAFVMTHPHPELRRSSVVSAPDQFGDYHPGVALHPEQNDYGTLTHEAGHLLHHQAAGIDAMDLSDHDDELKHGPGFAHHYQRALQAVSPPAAEFFGTVLPRVKRTIDMANGQHQAGWSTPEQFARERPHGAAAHPDADENGWVHHTYDEPMQHKAVTDKWPPYLTERPDEYGDLVPANVSRHNPRGPVGTEEDAHHAGWAGPYYHGTSKRRARDIRQNGFRQPRIHNWEMADYGTQEEVDAGNTHRTFFTPHRDEAEHFARAQHGDNGDVVTAYLHPDHLTTDEGGGFMDSTQVKDVAHAMAIRPARRTAAIRMVPPDEYRQFRYPDYPRAKTPDSLVRHFKKTSPEYYDKIKRDVQENGFTTPVLARWNDPRGKPLRRPELMEGHHRAAVAHELGIHLPVGDYDNEADYNTAFRAGQDWWRTNQRPTDDMPRQAAFTPTKRLFGPTQGLDHRLFDGEHLKGDVREYIISTLSTFWEPLFGECGWEEWAIVYFAGSEASEWTSSTLEGNNDFDVLIGVDYQKFRGWQSRTSKYQTMTDEEITADLNKGLRVLDEQTAAAMIPVDGILTGPWSNTWYVNQDSHDIRNIKPYAAYDVTHDRWAVKPPHLTDWSLEDFPEGHALVQEARAVAAYVRAILKLPEPYRTQQGFALWNHLHSDRSRAFGPNGEGWWDSGNVLEKWLDQAGLWEKLVEIMVRARAHPETLNTPVDWSNDPRSVKERA